MKRVLVGSPIRQKPSLLAEFLRSLGELRSADLEITYYFVDDNKDAESSALLRAFASTHPTAAPPSTVARSRSIRIAEPAAPPNTCPFPRFCPLGLLGAGHGV